VSAEQHANGTLVEHAPAVEEPRKLARREACQRLLQAALGDDRVVLITLSGLAVGRVVRVTRDHVVLECPDRNFTLPLAALVEVRTLKGKREP
jgi:hypothetical protein